MRKLYLLSLILAAIIVLVSGCSAPEAPTDETSISPETAEGQPVYGGTLRMVTNTGPTMLSYPPMMNPTAFVAVLPGAEKLLDIAEDRFQGNGLEPVLAESYEDDVANRRIIFHLRPEVRFHDGSPLNADNVIWHFQQLIDAKRLPYAEHWNGIKKIDDLTVQIDYTEYSNQLLEAWVLFPIFSREAWEAASGGDLQKGIDWTRSHCVGTGPFKLKEYIRDSHLIWEKNSDYWQEGKPYLDAIEVRIIPESQTCRYLLEAEQADFWQFGYMKDMEKKGFNLLSGWNGLIYSIWPNTSDSDSKWNDVRLREAIEFAIDKEWIVNALAPELFTALTMPVPPGEWGYDPDYPARGYDPEKARQLVIEAGYPDGIDAEMIIDSSYESRTLGTAIKGYLDDAGIRIKLDVADPGRFFATVYGNTPGPDLSLMYSSNDVNYLISYMRWFSTYAIAPMAYLGHTDEQRRLDDEAVLSPDPTDQEAATKKLIRYMTDKAMIIPVLWMPMLTLTGSYVHTDWLSRGTTCWHSEVTWMNAH